MYFPPAINMHTKITMKLSLGLYAQHVDLCKTEIWLRCAAFFRKLRSPHTLPCTQMACLNTMHATLRKLNSCWKFPVSVIFVQTWTIAKTFCKFYSAYRHSVQCNIWKVIALFSVILYYNMYYVFHNIANIILFHIIYNI